MSMIRDVLTEGERMALGLYIVGLHASQGRPIMSAYDGLPSERAKGFSEHLPEQWDREAIAFQEFARQRVPMWKRHLANGISRALCPQLDLPNVRWTALAHWLTASEKKQVMEGGFKAATKILGRDLEILARQWRRHRRLSNAVGRSPPADHPSSTAPQAACPHRRTPSAPFPPPARINLSLA